MFSFTSRYYNIALLEHETPDGKKIVYLRRRFVPPASRFNCCRSTALRRASVSTTSPRSTSAIPNSSGASATRMTRCVPKN